MKQASARTGGKYRCLGCGRVRHLYRIPAFLPVRSGTLYPWIIYVCSEECLVLRLLRRPNLRLPAEAQP